MKLKYHYDTCDLRISYRQRDGGIYTDVARKIFKKDISHYASNAAILEKDINYINGISVMFDSAEDVANPEKKGRIFQYGGYNPRRGLFCEML